MKTIIKILVIVAASNFANAQDIQYVSAENGLVVRERPSRGAIRVGTLDYGTAIEITEHTQLQLDVVDNNEKISGEWVKIKSIENDNDMAEGFVFNGFLTVEKLKKRFIVNYDEFTVSIEDVTEKMPEALIENRDDILSFHLDLDESIEGKTIRVKHHTEFRSIKIFQKHENSIAITDEASHCDIIDWQHYYSSWKPLNAIENHRKFKAKRYSDLDTTKFIEIDIEELKLIVNETCGKAWSETIKDVKSIKEAPVSITLSKIFLRIVMTDIDGHITEKIIIFEIPMGC